LVAQESFPMGVFVAVQRREGIGWFGDEGLGEGGRGGDGHAGAFAEQRDAVCRVADQDDSAV
jgi:hypothetical protein